MRRAGLALAAALTLAPPAFADEARDPGIITRFLEDSLSDAGREVRIEGFVGALSSRATIEELTIADRDGVWIVLRGAALDWNRGALLSRRLEVNELSAREIVLLRAPVTDDGEFDAPSPEAQPFALPVLPLSIRVDRVSADRVVLEPGLLGETAVVSLAGGARLENGAGTAELAIRRIDGGDGALTLAGRFDNADRRLTLDLALSEGPGGIAARLLGLPGTPAVALSVAGDGPLADFAARIGLATDGEDRLTGTVTLRGEGEADRAFAAELAGDLRPLLAPDLHPFFGPRAELSTQGLRPAAGGLILSDLLVATGALTLGGELRLGADGLPERILLEGELAAADGGPVVLPMAEPRATVERADIWVDFDAARSADWTVMLGVADFRGAGADIGRIALDGAGQIRRDDAGRSVTAALTFAAEGIAPADPALAEALGPALTGNLELVWRDGQPLALPVLRIEGAGLLAEGDAELAGGEITGRIATDLPDIARFSALAGRPLAGGVRGDVAGSFAPLSGAFDLGLALQGEDLRTGQAELDRLLAGPSIIAADVTRDETGTRLNSLALVAQTLTLQAEGTIATAGTALRGWGEFADLAVLGEPYGGALSAYAELDGPAEALRLTASATGQELSLGQPQADALLAGESRLSVDATFGADGAMRLDDFRLRAATLTVAATGTAEAEAAALDLRLDMTDLAVLGAGWGGRLDADASVALAGGVATVTARAEGRALAIGQAQADALIGGDSALALTARRDAEGRIAVETFTLRTGALTLGAAGDIGGQDANFAASLLLSDLAPLGPGWGGRLEADAILRQTGPRQELELSAEGTGLAVGNPAADILLRGATRLAANATLEDRRLRVRDIRLENPQLSVSADATYDDTTRQIDLRARLADLALLADGFDGPVTAEGRLTERAEGYGIDLRARGPGGTDLAAEGLVRRDLTADLGLAGRADLGLASRFIDDITLRGPLRYDLRLVGRPELSSLRGTVTGSDIRILAPRQFLSIEGMEATVTLADGRATLRAEGRGGRGGTIGLDGGIGLRDGFPADLTLRAEAFAVVDPELYATTVTGRLAVAGPLVGGGARIGGALTLGASELRIPGAGYGGRGFVPGAAIRHLGEPAEARLTRVWARIPDASGAGARRNRPFTLDIALSAPNRVFIRGRGLDAEVGGTLVLRGTTFEVIPAGEFGLIRGRLDILGNRFTLTEGFASLQGRFIPFVSLSATTEADGISATVTLEGVATEPQIRFSSMPELPEEEVVSRLLFGRDLGALSPFQAAQLASAVATLSGREGLGLVDRVRENFGLDDLDVTTDEDGNASVRAGAYIADNVYTDLRVDAQGRSEVTINLDVTPQITLRGSAGSDGRSGVGVFFERDY